MASACEQFTDALFQEAIAHACRIFGLQQLHTQQLMAVEALLRGQDVLACLPTGFGKSLIFQILPGASAFLADHGCPQFGKDPIVVVCSPLVALMRVQVGVLLDKGVSAVFVGEDYRLNDDIQNGKFTFVYGSPETLVGQQVWRSVLSSDLYARRVVAVAVDEAHTVVHWGDDSGDEDPFREWCGKVGELRALVASPLVALTATATSATRTALKSKLGLQNCRTIVQSPDRPNIRLTVHKVSPANPASQFTSVIRELKTKRNECRRLFVYCQKISDCSDFYVEFMSELGDFAYWPDGSPHVSDHRLVAMYHSATPEYNKALVLNSLQDPAGVCRVVFATSALGMGVDFQGLYNIIHWGPPSKLEHYMQEIGRCGRDGVLSTAKIFYHGHQLRHCDKHMLEYIKATSGCRREMILAAFNEVPTLLDPPHLCCDLCVCVCTCPTDHSQLCSLTPDNISINLTGCKQRCTTGADKDMVVLKLAELFIVDTEKVTQIPLVKELLEKLNVLFSVDDLISMVNVESSQQAQVIFEVLSSCFPDMLDVEV